MTTARLLSVRSGMLSPWLGADDFLIRLWVTTEPLPNLGACTRVPIQRLRWPSGDRVHVTSFLCEHMAVHGITGCTWPTTNSRTVRGDMMLCNERQPTSCERWAPVHTSLRPAVPVRRVDALLPIGTAWRVLASCPDRPTAALETLPHNDTRMLAETNMKCVETTQLLTNNQLPGTVFTMYDTV